MNIEQKVGQMLCFAFHGTTYSHQIDTFLKEFNLGGIVYFARNIKDIREVVELNQQIQLNSDIPMFISLDQEGGSVLRVMDSITPLPGAMSLSASDKNNIYDICYLVGKDLKHLGFNINYAPVGDVNNNPLNPVINSRSYSDDPCVVSECVIKAYRGFQDSLILPTIKHFPGHGNTNVDSHIGLPVVKADINSIENCELIPFKKAIEDGIDGVMISHILYEAYDVKFPATLSYNIITKLLKEKLGFKGLIVTDSLTMGAINNTYSKEEIILNGVNAGNDILIFCGRADLDDQREIYQTFVRLVKDGKIPIERINESVDKILRLKQKYCNNDIDLGKIATEEGVLLARDLQQSAITLVKSSMENIIKKDDKVIIIFPEIRLASLVDNDNQNYHSLKNYLNFKEVIIGPDFNDFKKITKISQNYDKIIMCTYNVRERDYQTQVFNCLDKSKTIVVSMRSPYDLNHLQGVENYICIYELTKEALKALSLALIGQIPFKGKLPIKL